MARVGLRWVAWAGLAASCAFGTAACSDEDEPDNARDAAPDTRTDSRSDASDQREAGTPDATGNCVGGGDAARDGALGMIAVQQLNCARCHQDEPVDAGLILSGKLTSLVADAAVFPRNLTPDPTTGLGCWTDDQIIDAVMNGVGRQGQTLCPRMPKYGTRIDGGTAQEIVDFLRSIPAAKKGIQGSVCSTPPPPVDGGVDGGTAGDAGDGGAPPPDAVTPDDAGPDSTPPADAGPDAVAPDAGLDSTPPVDARPDAVAPDVGPDSKPPVDARPDAVAPDAGPDSKPPVDAGPDAVAPDAGPDSTPPVDAGPDSTPPADAGPDAVAPDVGSDSSLVDVVNTDVGDDDGG